MAYIGQEPVNTFSPVPTKDTFTGDGSTTTFDLQNAVVNGGENALEVFVNNVRQEPGTGKAFTLGPDGSNDIKRITFSAAPANGASIYVINDKTSNVSLIKPTDLNGVELILDADADTSITADTDDRIDFKIAGSDHFAFLGSSGDTVIKPLTDAKDIIFQQFDGNKVLEINDSGFVGVGGNSNATGEIRIFEDTDNGSGYVGFAAPNVTTSRTYIFPAADGSSGTQLTTDGSGNLSWAAAQITLANDGNNRIVTGDGSGGLNAEANLNFDGSTLAVTGAATVSTNLDVDGTTNLDAVDIDGAVQIDGTVTVGVDDTGYDFKLFGDTASAFALWDASADDLILSGAAGLVVPDGQLTLGSTAITTTGAEINILDGGTSASSVTIVDADQIILNDGGTMKQVAVSALNSYTSSSIAADDISTGNAAINITTSSGNITIDAAANDTDIIFKGTDNTSDITMLTLDGSEAGAATFNNAITSGAVITSGAGLVIADGGNIGSASDTDAIAISSGGVVTMNQIPVFSAGINVSGGNIAGTLSTAAQANITSLGTLTALTVDDVAVDGKVITMTGSSSDTAVFTAGTNGTLSIVTTDDSAAAANITITADGTAELAGTTVTLNSSGDIVLDADGADLKFADGGTDLLSITNSSSDVVIKPLVDAKDIIFHQYDGTSILEINDGGYARFTAAAINPEITLSDASTISWNALTQPVAKVTLAGNRTMAAASGGIAGQFVSVLVIQDGTGSRTLTWNAAYEFAEDTAPTLTTTASKGDLFVFRYNGAKWLEVGRNLNLTLS